MDTSHPVVLSFSMDSSMRHQLWDEFTALFACILMKLIVILAFNVVTVDS